MRGPQCRPAEREVRREALVLHHHLHVGRTAVADHPNFILHEQKTGRLRNVGGWCAGCSHGNLVRLNRLEVNDQTARDSMDDGIKGLSGRLAVDQDRGGGTRGCEDGAYIGAYGEKRVIANTGDRVAECGEHFRGVLAEGDDFESCGGGHVGFCRDLGKGEIGDSDSGRVVEGGAGFVKVCLEPRVYGCLGDYTSVVSRPSRTTEILGSRVVVKRKGNGIRRRDSGLRGDDSCQIEGRKGDHPTTPDLLLQ
ncbi:calcineurin-like metallo-phosphoesterase super family protein [Striga asiatica]|uniref:Calcineurin-like metallo-phosphoesterase super family protein n=1 Tax=Striga asiatica TaxID=4170 RepID=A0A5A7RBX2_STRAF|nr:calcineurin-like metallo-phosphoesterase super family protein [Striga asiatica]